MISQQGIVIQTSGRGMINITATIANIISDSSITTGLCNIFLHHTSASIILCENADTTVQRDMEAFMQRIVPDGDSLFKHTQEGPDDMPAHVRAILTQNSLNVPITKNALNLGVWQGIFVWEHRLAAYKRKLTISVWGSM